MSQTAAGLDICRGVESHTVSAASGPPTADTIAARIHDGQNGVKVFERQAGIYQLAGTVRPGAWQNGKPTDFGLSLAAVRRPGHSATTYPCA